MRITLVGTRGFLSNTLGQYANENDIEVVSIGRKQSDKYESIRFIQCDFRDGQFPFQECLESDYVFYVAALGVQSINQAKNEDLFFLNTYFPIILSEQLSTLKFSGKLVTFGSYFEIGKNDNDKYFTETEVLNSELPVPNNYCVSKRLLTKYIASSINPTINYHFILPTIYGEKEMEHRLIPYLIKSVLSKKTISLTSGEQVRQYLYAADFSRILFFLLNKKEINTGLHNFPSSETLSVREVANEVLNYFQLPLSSIVFNSTVRADTDMKILKLLTEGTNNFDFKKIESIIPKYINEYQKH